MPQFGDNDEKTRKTCITIYMVLSITLFAGAELRLICRGWSRGQLRLRPQICLHVVEPHFAGAHHEVPVKEDCLDDHIPRQHLGGHHLRQNS